MVVREVSDRSALRADRFRLPRFPAISNGRDSVERILRSPEGFRHIVEGAPSLEQPRHRIGVRHLPPAAVPTTTPGD